MILFIVLCKPLADCVNKLFHKRHDINVQFTYNIIMFGHSLGLVWNMLILISGKRKQVPLAVQI